MWRHTSTELSNGFATQSAISSKRKADAPNVPSIFLSAECLEECTRGNRRGTSTKRVSSRDIEGQLRKESVRFRTKTHSASSREVRKVQYHNEANTSRDTRL